MTWTWTASSLSHNGFALLVDDPPYGWKVYSGGAHVGYIRYGHLIDVRYALESELAGRLERMAALDHEAQESVAYWTEEQKQGFVEYGGALMERDAHRERDKEHL